jgi:hypothetical protein
MHPVYFPVPLKLVLEVSKGRLVDVLDLVVLPAANVEDFGDLVVPVR